MTQHLPSLLASVLLASACSMAFAQTTRVEFYSPGIVRVTKTDAQSTTDPMAAKKSYSVVLTPAGDASLTGQGELKSECMTVRVNAEGVVSFYDKAGSLLLTEQSQGSVTPITEGVDRGKYSVGQTWQLEADEAIFGLGQRREGQTMNQRGTAFRLWNTNTHIYIPYFTSQKGYGVYWDNAGETFWSDDASGTTLRSSVAEGGIDYYFLYKDGTQDGVVEQIRLLSGQATMFPLWAYGYWQCRERYKTPDELSGVLDEYRKRDIPIDAIVQDWQYWGCDSNWNAMRFENPHYLNKIGDPKQMRYLPNDEDPQAEIAKIKAQGAPRLTTPQQMVDYVHQNNAHLMITLWPDFGPWTKQYKELDKMGALLPFDTWPRNRGVLVYDVFNPKARDIYWKYLTNLYRMGFDAWWTDSTEPDHFEKEGDLDYMTYDGSWRSVKNAFPLVHNRGIYEHQRGWVNPKPSNPHNLTTSQPQKRSLQMTRSASFGIQHYGTFSWSGDIVSNWSDMQNQVPSGLNYVICGIPMWNTDLGGFFGWDFGNDPKCPYAQELMVRWMQWGTFMPLMRNHCSSPMVSEIWHYGEPGDWAYDVQKHFIELRYRLLPYIYSQAGATVQRSDLMMRPLVMDFADDKVAIRRADEYMFGRALLVKPITQPLYSWYEGRTSHWIYPQPDKAAAPVEVYLPAGTQWWDFWSNELHEGGKTIRRLAPIDIMPVFVKAGSIIPFGPKVQYSGEKAWDNLELRIYPGADGDFVLYEDAGDGYGYEQGEFAQIRFHWNDGARTLTIDARRGNYPGMLQSRQFRIHVVSAASEAGDTEASTFQRTVTYDGQAMSVTL